MNSDIIAEYHVRHWVVSVVQLECVAVADDFLVLGAIVRAVVMGTGRKLQKVKFPP
jgi:hypothetical protein